MKKLPTSLRPRSVAIEVSIEPACSIHLQSAEPGAPVPRRRRCPNRRKFQCFKRLGGQRPQRGSLWERSVGATRGALRSRPRAWQVREVRGGQGHPQGWSIARLGSSREDEAADAEKAARPGTGTGSPADDQAVARAGMAEWAASRIRRLLSE